MDCKDVEIKQQYLRSEIIDKGYDPQMFSEFLGKISDKGLDVEKWSMEELGEAVYKFQCENGSGEGNNENTNETNVNDNGSTTIESNDNTNTASKETIVHNKSSELKADEFIPCKKQERNTLTDMSNIEIIISEPQLVKEGIFSFSYYQFTVTCDELSSKCTRKLSDFEWLVQKLKLIYPATFIPPFPQSSLFEKNSSQTITKKLTLMNKFIDSLSKNDLIRSSTLFIEFLTLPQDKWSQTKKQYDTLSSPVQMKDFLTLEGVLDIRINDEIDNKVIDISSDIQTKISLYKSLNTALNNLQYEFDIISSKFREVSIALKNLSNAYSKSINGSYIEKAFESLSKITFDWARGYLSQKTFFDEELRSFFKYISKEVNVFTDLYEEYNVTRNNYLDCASKITKHINDERYQTEYFSAKVCFGFILNRLYYEYIRVNQEHADRIRKQFTCMNERKQILYNDYINLTSMLNMNI